MERGQLLNRVLPPHPAWLRWVEGAFYVSLILYLGKDIFIPLSFALLISFILHPICTWLEKRGLSRLTSIIMALLFLLILIVLVLSLLINQVVAFANEFPALHAKVGKSVEQLGIFVRDSMGISIVRQEEMIKRVMDQVSGNFVGVFQSILATSVFSLLLFILIPVYVVLILFYRTYWMEVLQKIFPGERKETLYEIMTLTIQAYYNFIKGMALVYLLVGILNSLGLFALGIPHPILFGFVAAILTFIPYVGIIAGSLLPIAIAWLTFDSIWYPLGIVAVFAFVQYLEANVIFPLAVSRRLHVNALVMLLSIFAGGLIWGVAGMILFVPFVGIAKLIADHNPKWKMVSMILGVEQKQL